MFTTTRIDWPTLIVTLIYFPHFIEKHDKQIFDEESWITKIQKNQLNFFSSSFIFNFLFGKDKFGSNWFWENLPKMVPLNFLIVGVWVSTTSNQNCITVWYQRRDSFPFSHSQNILVPSLSQKWKIIPPFLLKNN